MALDSGVALRWAIGVLGADATLVALVAGGQVYRDVVPQDVDTKTKPGLAVSLESSQPGPRPLRMGARTNAYTNVTMQTHAVMETSSYKLIEAVMSRVTDLLDGNTVHNTADGRVYECTVGQDQAYRDNETVPHRNMVVFWEMKAKAA